MNPPGLILTQKEIEPKHNASIRRLLELIGINILAAIIGIKAYYWPYFLQRSSSSSRPFA